MSAQREEFFKAIERDDHDLVGRALQENPSWFLEGRIDSDEDYGSFRAAFGRKTETPLYVAMKFGAMNVLNLFAELYPNLPSSTEYLSYAAEFGHTGLLSPYNISRNPCTNIFESLLTDIIFYGRRETLEAFLPMLNNREDPSWDIAIVLRDLFENECCSGNNLEERYLPCVERLLEFVELNSYDKKKIGEAVVETARFNKMAALLLFRKYGFDVVKAQTYNCYDEELEGEEYDGILLDPRLAKSHPVNEKWDYYTMLFCAAGWGKGQEMVRFLLSIGANQSYDPYDPRDQYPGHLPLFNALSGGAIEIAQYLVKDNPVHTSIRDHNGATALQLGFRFERSKERFNEIFDKELLLLCPILDLHRIPLTPEQIVTLLDVIISSKQLTTLNLEGVDLTPEQRDALYSAMEKNHTITSFVSSGDNSPFEVLCNRNKEKIIKEFAIGATNFPPEKFRSSI
ncbi:MAG UNVERIFIED_CONTAM: ankyrin repeat domain-containing protein [Planctomycetaceae bacterium]|jgi:hypothetical protein